MLETAMVQQLPMKKVGKDTDTVKARIGELWSNASRAEKKSAQELTGVNPVTFHRAVTKGSLNLRVAVGLAQVFKVNPAYLTGAANVRGTCSEKNLNAFLTEHGVVMGQTDVPATAEINETADAPGTATVVEADAPPETKTNRRGARKQGANKQVKQPRGQRKQTTPIEQVPESTMSAEAATATLTSETVVTEERKTSVSPETQKFMDAMTDEDMAALLKSLQIRMKANMPEAIKTMDEIKRLLLSIG